MHVHWLVEYHVVCSMMNVINQLETTGENFMEMEQHCGDCYFIGACFIHLPIIRKRVANSTKKKTTHFLPIEFQMTNRRIDSNRMAEFSV